VAILSVFTGREKMPYTLEYGPYTGAVLTGAWYTLPVFHGDVSE